MPPPDSGSAEGPRAPGSAWEDKTQGKTEMRRKRRGRKGAGVGEELGGRWDASGGGRHPGPGGLPGGRQVPTRRASPPAARREEIAS